nr:MAG TPA: hypothetical protein [Caudoviricetes sp.]
MIQRFLRQFLLDILGSCIPHTVHYHLRIPMSSIYSIRFSNLGHLQPILNRLQVV